MVAETEHEQSERLKVEAWRQAVLEQAGVAKVAARLLSEGDGDLHQMLEAHDHGCSDNQLLRIFL